MNEGVESRAAACRIVTRRPEWLAQVGDEDRLERWGRRFIQYSYVPYREGRRATPQFRVTSCGHPEIEMTLVGGVPDRRIWIPHETGHVLMRAWLSRLQADPFRGSHRQNRLAFENNRKDENTADRFLLAWLFPPELFRTAPDLRLIAERARLPLAMVERRAEQVIPDYELQELPEWCAARTTYDLHYSAGPAGLHVVWRESRFPAFFIPTAPSNRPYREFEVTADLVALTAEEFGQRYRKYCAGWQEPGALELGEPLPIRISELRSWAIETRPGRASARQAQVVVKV